MTLEDVVFFVDSNRQGENHFLRVLDGMLTQKMLVITNAHLNPRLTYDQFCFFKQPKKNLGKFYEELTERIEDAKQSIRD